MTKFENYYNNRFQKDLLNFIGKIPVENNKHYNRAEFNIQYFFLTPKYKYYDVIETNDRANFAISLFWTILVDQLMYSEYKYEYQTFQKKTMYPKFIGNCTAPSLFSSQCGKHLNPKKIFDAVNDYNDNGNIFEFDREIFKNDEANFERNRIEINLSFEQSKITIKNEIKNYFENYQPQINWEEFWNKCQNEI